MLVISCNQVRTGQNRPTANDQGWAISAIDLFSDMRMVDTSICMIWPNDREERNCIQANRTHQFHAVLSIPANLRKSTSRPLFSEATSTCIILDFVSPDSTMPKCDMASAAAMVTLLLRQINVGTPVVCK